MVFRPAAPRCRLWRRCRQIQVPCSIAALAIVLFAARFAYRTTCSVSSAWTKPLRIAAVDGGVAFPGTVSPGQIAICIVVSIIATALVHLLLERLRRNVPSVATPLGSLPQRLGGRNRRRRHSTSSDDDAQHHWLVSSDGTLNNRNSQSFPSRYFAPRQISQMPRILPKDGLDEFMDEPTSVGGVWVGFSMEEAMKHAEEHQKLMMARTPAEVMADLQKGNARFWMGRATRPEKSAFERRALITKQFPSVAVLGCSDSRVPVEIIFDQGLGDMFVIRVAGNCLDTTTIASLQYAVHHLKIKVLIVMGHEGCGAVKAAFSAGRNASSGDEPQELNSLLDSLQANLDEDRLKSIQDARAHDREAVVSNVRKQVERIAQDVGIMEKVREKELLVCGAFYELSSGIVDFFFEVSPTDVWEGVPTPKIARPGVTQGVQSRYDVQVAPSLTSPRVKLSTPRAKGALRPGADKGAREMSDERPDSPFVRRTRTCS